MKTIRIGSGAGFADDRIEPAAELAERGRLDYLVFECLAERTIALAQLDKLADPDLGYNEWLEDRMNAVLDECARQRVTVITNMGAANPAAAARVVAEVARRRSLRGMTIAVVTGDDVLEKIRGTDLPLLEREGTLGSLSGRLVSANAYLGAEAVVEALRAGADVVITGRIADPSLYLAPLIHEFGWAPDDWDLIAAGVAAGHLLECAGQVTGGYFADPGRKDVPGLERLGFPIAAVREDGYFEVTKVEGSGGEVTPRTCTEQILYEVHDPAAYKSADVVADFSGVRFRQVGQDTVAVTGIRGRPRPDELKISVGYRDGWVGEGEISYAGPNAGQRGQLALDIVRKRLELIGVTVSEARFDLVGMGAVHRGFGTAGRGVGAAGQPAQGEPGEVRLRVAGRTADASEARRIGHEVVSLWLNGPSGGGGARRRTYEVIAIVSVFLPRELVQARVHYLEVR